MHSLECGFAKLAVTCMEMCISNYAWSDVLVQRAAGKGRQKCSEAEERECCCLQRVGTGPGSNNSDSAVQEAQGVTTFDITRHVIISSVTRTCYQRHTNSSPAQLLVSLISCLHSRPTLTHRRARRARAILRTSA